MICEGGYPTDRLTVPATATNGFTRKINFLGKQPSGYWSDKAWCHRGLEGAPPGLYVSPKEWNPLPCPTGLREITVDELWFNACYINSDNAGYRQHAINFCDTLTDNSGNPRRPIACGGTDPDQFVNDPVQSGINAAGVLIEELSGFKADEISEELSAFRRNVIIGVIVVIAIVILMGLLWSK